MGGVSSDNQVTENASGKEGRGPQNLIPVCADTAIFGRIGLGVAKRKNKSGYLIKRRLGYVMSNVKRNLDGVRSRMLKHRIHYARRPGFYVHAITDPCIYSICRTDSPCRCATCQDQQNH